MLKIPCFKKRLFAIIVLLFCIPLILIVGAEPVLAWDRYITLNPLTNKEFDTKPQRTIEKISADSIEITYEFPGLYVSDMDILKTECQILNIEGFSNINEPGSPALPVHNEIIAVPRGAAVSLEILDIETFDFKGFNIAPAREPARDTEGAEEPGYLFNDKIYKNDIYYPEEIVRITDSGVSRGTSLAYLQISPIAFNPATEKIRAYSKIHFRIDFDGGKEGFSAVAYENSKHYTDLLKRNVLNSVSIPDGIIKEQIAFGGSSTQRHNLTEQQIPFGSNSTGKQYIIITHSAYINQANQLADWKRQLGYSVEVVSRSSWTSADVKDAVHSRYAAWTPKPDYFVIIGDHTGSFAVPGEMRTEPDGDPFATDLYYACMDGTSDYTPDMAHGRIPVSSEAEAQVVIDKIINYEKTPVQAPSFYSNILNCAQYQDDNNDGYADRRFCHTSEDIRDYLQNNYGYTSRRIYYTESTFDITQLHYNNGGYSDGQLISAELRTTVFNWNGGSSDITNAIDGGKFMIFHRDHGYVGGSGWAHPYYTTGSMTSMANGDFLPVVFSMNCHTGEFQLPECFAEKFLRMENKGAVGVIAAAYSSYSGYNDAMSEGMIDAIWSTPGLCPDFGDYGNGNTYTIGPGNDIYTMGDVVNQGLFAMIQNFGDNKYTHELFHYFGDPAMKIWTADPNANPISATHAATIDCEGTSFVVSGSTPYAAATLVQNNTLIARAELDASGNGALSYQITAPGETFLTISRHNYRPYTSAVTLTGNCNFPPYVRTDTADTITDSSATFHGEILDDFGQNILESGFVYSTTPDPLSGGSGVTDVQTSPLIQFGLFSADITALSSSTRYYVKAYVTGENGTSYGGESNFTTDCGAFTSFPLNEGFEGGGTPACWLYEGNAWEYSSGGHNGSPASAHSGSYNARFYNASFTPLTSSLAITNLSFLNKVHASLSFWHTQANWGQDQDELRIYYKNSSQGSWVLLAEYTEPVNAWTERTVDLPDLSDDYCIAFEATAKYGYGVCIDDITISTPGEKKNIVLTPVYLLLLE